VSDVKIGVLILLIIITSTYVTGEILVQSGIQINNSDGSKINFQSLNNVTLKIGINDLNIQSPTIWKDLSGIDKAVTKGIIGYEWAYNATGYSTATFISKQPLNNDNPDYICWVVNANAKPFSEQICVYFPPQYTDGKGNIIDSGKIPANKENLTQIRIIEFNEKNPNIATILFKDYYDPTIVTTNLTLYVPFNETSGAAAKDFAGTKNDNVTWTAANNNAQFVNEFGNWRMKMNDSPSGCGAPNIESGKEWYVPNAKDSASCFEITTNSVYSTGGPNPTGQYILNGNDGGVAEWVVYLQNGTLYFRNNGGSPGNNMSTLSANRAYHICMVMRTGVSATYYVNGTQISTYGIADKEGYTGSMQVGSNDCSNSWLNGTIRQLRFWSGYAPTATEILDVYNTDVNVTSNTGPSAPTNISGFDGVLIRDVNMSESGNATLMANGSVDANGDTITYEISKGNTTYYDLYDSTNFTVLNKNASTYSNGTIATSRNVQWTNQTRAGNSDNIYTVALNIGRNGTTTLQLTNFGFTIPVNATIYGIQVQTEIKAATTNRLNISNITLIQNGNIRGLNNKPGVTVTNADVVQLSGGNNNLWGLTLTPADINNASFGVSIIVNCTSATLTTGMIDNVNMTIYYDNTTITSTPNMTYNVIGNHTQGGNLTWNLANEAIGETYESFRARSIDLSGSNTWSNYFNVTSNFTIIAAAVIAGSANMTCTPPALNANWRINLTENCSFQSSINIGVGNISFINTTGTPGGCTFNSTLNYGRINLSGVTKDFTIWIGNSARLYGSFV
jgi:hypothetical protein